MSSPYDRDNWNRQHGRDDNWERERINRNRGRAQNQRHPEYIYEEDEDEYEGHEHDPRDHDHHEHYEDERNFQGEDVRRYAHRAQRHDPQFYAREREFQRDEYIPERSRRMGSLLGIFERPGEEEMPQRPRPVRAEFERGYYPQEEDRNIDEKMQRLHLPPTEQERRSIEERLPMSPTRLHQEQEGFKGRGHYPQEQERNIDERMPRLHLIPQEQERRSIEERLSMSPTRLHQEQQRRSLEERLSIPPVRTSLEQERKSGDERISITAPRLFPGPVSVIKEPQAATRSSQEQERAPLTAALRSSQEQERISLTAARSSQERERRSAEERLSITTLTPPVPPVDIPQEPPRSSFEYRQQEDVNVRENGKDRERSSVEKDKDSGKYPKLSKGSDVVEAEPTEKDSLLQKDAEVKKETSSVIRNASISSQKRLSKESAIRRSSSEMRKRSSISKKLSGSYKRPSTSNYSVLKEEVEDDHIPVKENGSILLPVLEDSEKIFHELVASGDVVAVSQFLESHPDFNINCVNYQKMSALHVAVHEQDEEMVKFLLSQKSLDVFDCALHAVKLGNIKIVELILDKIRETSPGLEDAVVTHSVDFSDDMTPLILAAQLGDYEMIDFLIKRDHKIPPVHHPYCKCETCKAELKKYDRLRYSTKKLDLYKAISNPMYIFHVTDDPILRAFELAKELQDASKVFPQFYVSYEELWKELRNFSVDLISCCRNSKEVEIVLNKPSGPVAGQVKFPRLQYAIDLKQKEFVSHAYTQAVLGDAWTEDLLDWQIRSPLMQFFSIFPRIAMLPFMTFMCVFMPNHHLVKKWRIPVNRMISSCASYLIFLVILLIESNLDKSNQRRGPPNSGLEWIIILYVFGYIWDNIRLCFKTGVKRYFTYMWHWFDCIMLTLFVITFLSWFASWADVKANDEADLPRKYWNPTDPLLIAEGFFAVAVVMAFFRLFRILSLNYYLGPFQVSIGKMTLDIGKFIIIYFILLLSWTAGYSRFYQPYRGMLQKDEASGTTVAQVDSFVSFGMTLKTYFWSIFGMSPIESADVIIENLPGDSPDKPIKNHHGFTEFVGYIGFTAFQFLSAVVVLNMLIACMANTFTKVTDNISVEWIFGRSQVYLSYMAASTLPPPFNLIPTASGFKTMIKWFRLLGKPQNGQKAKFNMTHCCFIENEVDPYINSEFPALMSELAQRYLRLKEEEKEGTSNQDVVEIVRTELNEVREILRRMEEKMMENR